MQWVYEQLTNIHGDFMAEGGPLTTADRNTFHIIIAITLDTMSACPLKSALYVAVRAQA